MTDPYLKYFLGQRDLPSWLGYPEGFIKLAKLNISRFPPWELMNAVDALSVYEAMRSRYNREIFPLALRLGSDDILCLEKGFGERVKLINAYSSPGHETLFEFDSFWGWFRQAIEDMIEFEM
jgi:hypothetical protein